MPAVRGLEQQYGDRVTFVRVNILQPESAALMKQFGFSATPEFYLVDAHGQILGFWNEDFEIEDIRQAIEAGLQE